MKTTPFHSEIMINKLYEFFLFTFSQRKNVAASFICDNFVTNDFKLCFRGTKKSGLNEQRYWLPYLVYLMKTVIYSCDVLLT